MVSKMKIKSKVVKFTGERKVVEIPYSVRENFSVGDIVSIEKSTGKITKPTTSVRIIANKREDKSSPKKS